ncbi:hypothetical protein [Faecalibacterium prausnitzii]|uniref:hypothetical protein n=1 Tax=Faecalibacterium prausnitzii TaxID=853 RepID=UPI0022E7E383|nr:hypothetical protein [Faecalibacterium prausnitzii]
MAGPRTTVEAQAFYRMYHSYADSPNPWDRLRWCRYGLDLLQKEVAAMVGMEEWLYQDLECGAFHRFGRPPHHRRGAGVLPYVPLLRRHPEPMGPSALVPLWS